MCLRQSPTEGKAATAQGGRSSGQSESQRTLLNKINTSPHPKRNCICRCASSWGLISSLHRPLPGGHPDVLPGPLPEMATGTSHPPCRDLSEPSAKWGQQQSKQEHSLLNFQLTHDLKKTLRVIFINDSSDIDHRCNGAGETWLIHSGLISVPLMELLFQRPDSSS